MTITFTPESFQEALEQDKPVLVQFTALWCGPCKAVTPLVAQLAEEYKDSAIIGKVDIDDYPELAQRYKVRGVPTFVALKATKIVATLVGGQPKKSLAELLERTLTE